MKSFLRIWATPLVVGAFLIMGTTGVLMFFHLDTGLNKEIHEWAGLLMVVGGLAHLTLNWRPFTTYLKRPLASTIMALGAVVLGASFLTVGAAGGPEAAIGAVVGAVGEARVEVLAELAGKSTDQVIADISAAGLSGANGQSTLSGLAKGDRGLQMQAISAVFAKTAE
jgi:hypothetical protein